MTGDSAPLRFPARGGKLRNGLFLRATVFYDDRIAFKVFSSRRFTEQDLRELRLTDNLGTKYRRLPFEDGLIDDRVQIEFTPALPVGASRLKLEHRASLSTCSVSTTLERTD